MDLHTVLVNCLQYPCLASSFPKLEAHESCASRCVTEGLSWQQCPLSPSLYWKWFIVHRTSQEKKVLVDFGAQTVNQWTNQFKFNKTTTHSRYCASIIGHMFALAKGFVEIHLIPMDPVAWTLKVEYKRYAYRTYRVS